MFKSKICSRLSDLDCSGQAFVDIKADYRERVISNIKRKRSCFGTAAGFLKIRWMSYGREKHEFIQKMV